MKRIFTLLLVLVMTLALAAPALAAEDVFAASETEEAAAPEAPAAPVEEEPEAEAPAEAPDMPQAAAVEPEDTEADPATGKLTILGDTDMLWYVSVVEDAGQTDYQLDYSDITIKPGDVLVLALDYRYTVQPNWDVELYDGRCFLTDTPFGDHEGDPANLVDVIMDRAPNGSCDLTLTVVEGPDAPTLIPVNVTAPEGVTVKTEGQVFAGMTGGLYCDAGYIPFFLGAISMGSLEMDDGTVWTMFAAYDDVESVEVDVQKATGYLNLTGFTDKVLLTLAVDDYLALADPDNGIVGGTHLTIGVEAGYSLKSDIEPFNEVYMKFDGVNTHFYAIDVPDTGDINVEVVKTLPDAAVPASGNGWAYDKATGDYYYFVNGEQKFDYWAGEPAASKWGYWYYIGIDGKLATGFQYVENPNGTGWYLFQADNKDGCIGRMLTGWQWTWSEAGMGWFNTAHGGLNGQCTYTTAWGAYDAATGMWADGHFHW